MTQKYDKEFKINAVKMYLNNDKSIEKIEEELRALKRELYLVRQERDILKKAVAIFSEPRGKGTSS
ncbi:MAG: hypothetical protein J0H87_09120 [Holosporales bacterium]|nr:hypothetical protein [Holosporales bacterium]